MKKTSEFGLYEGYNIPAYLGYSLSSFYLTMRDGVKIAIDLALPDGLSKDDRIPAILIQTRYWRAAEPTTSSLFSRACLSDRHFNNSWGEGAANTTKFFTRHGYAVVKVDVRGAGASFGSRSYPLSPDEVRDGAEIVDWIIAQSWSNGRVGAWGVSYLGATAEWLLLNNHPAVKAVIPMFICFDEFPEDMYPGGICFEAYEAWGGHVRELDSNILPSQYGLLAKRAVKGVKPVDDDRGRQQLKAAVEEHKANFERSLEANLHEAMLRLTCRDDRDKFSGVTVDDFSLHRHIDRICQSGAAVYIWASYQDTATADGAIKRFLNYTNPLKVVIGAWSHGARFYTSPYRSKKEEEKDPFNSIMQESLRFFDYYLKDVDNGIAREPRLRYYTLGEEVWKTADHWPPAPQVMQRWFLGDQKTLTQAKPTEEHGYDEYAIDFEASTGKKNRWYTVFTGGDVVYEKRTEQDKLLLTYTSEPLAADLEITGYPVATLYVASTHTDGAFFVYLEEVDENGVVRYLTEGQLRAIHRRLSTKAPPYRSPVPYRTFQRKDMEPLVLGEIATLTFALNPISALIRQGRHIRIAIAGHDKDTFARIPATGNPIIRLFRNALHASHVDLLVIR